MNKKLVTKICAFLLENDVMAQDVYFHWNEIHKELANIEGSRKGIISESMKWWGGETMQNKTI